MGAVERGELQRGGMSDHSAITSTPENPFGAADWFADSMRKLRESMAMPPEYVTPGPGSYGVPALAGLASALARQNRAAGVAWDPATLKVTTGKPAHPKQRAIANACCRRHRGFWNASERRAMRLVARADTLTASYDVRIKTPVQFIELRPSSRRTKDPLS